MDVTNKHRYFSAVVKMERDRTAKIENTEAEFLVLGHFLSKEFNMR